ncbi:MAG: B12-binding domain-containing radical SAM protein [Pseudomonadota bacterium]
MSAARRLMVVRFAPWMAYADRHPHDLMWPMEALVAAAFARRRGWESRILDLHVEAYEEGQVARRVLAADPELLLITSTSATMAAARLLAARLRRARPGLRAWAVGQHASALPGDLVYPDSPFDGAVRGEWGVAAPALLEGRHDFEGAATWSAADGGLRLVGQPAEAHDLDSLPPIDPSGLHLRRYRMRSMHVPSLRPQRWGYLHTSRGCQHACIFCSPTLRQSYGAAWRGHSAERVVDDLARLQRDHRLSAFYFLDDLFSFDRGRVLAISEELLRRRVRLHWVVQTRADRLDPDVLRAMKAAGCCSVKIGVESGSDRVLRVLGKGVSRDGLLESARAIKESGLFLTACFILGNPDETLDEVEETWRMARAIGADMIQVAFHTPHPGSISYERYCQQVEDMELLTHYELQAVNLSRIARHDLERKQREFYLRYYFSPDIFLNYLRRRALYRMADPDEWKLVVSALRFWNRGESAVAHPGRARPVVPGLPGRA